MIVWRNGEFIDGRGAISATDRGYLIGDGVFETLLVRNSRTAFLRDHLARLRRGADILSMRADLDDEHVRAAIGELSERSGLTSEAVCRITVTRSGGARGLVASDDSTLETLIALHPAPQKKEFCRLAVAEPRRLAGAVTNSFKCIGAYAPNMIARTAAARAGADEAVLLNEFGRISCASAANIFVVSGDALMTPPESEGAMPGVTRARVIEAAVKVGVEVRVEPVFLAALQAAPILLTNSAIGAVRASFGADKPVSALVSVLITAYERLLEQEFVGRLG